MWQGEYLLGCCLCPDGFAIAKVRPVPRLRTFRGKTCDMLLARVVVVAGRLGLGGHLQQPGHVIVTLPTTTLTHKGTPQLPCPETAWALLPSELLA